MSLQKALKEEKEWDKYWTKKKTFSQKIYRLVAGFYRNFIIRKNLTEVLQKEFKNGSKLLHAGSGSGQVDLDIKDAFDITALDISKEALKIYKIINGQNSQVLKASIFDIPVAKETFDGIYNLGVHEHFTKEENEKILKEFSRILKTNGKIVLFWPPKYGLSVRFLNSLHFILNDILKNKIRLHPDEISLIDGEKQIKEFLKNNGFKVKKFYFGPKDIYTYCIIVAEKHRE